MCSCSGSTSHLQKINRPLRRPLPSELNLPKGYVGVMLGFYRDYIGIMEKKTKNYSISTLNPQVPRDQAMSVRRA